MADRHGVVLRLEHDDFALALRFEGIDGPSVTAGVFVATLASRFHLP